MSVKYDQKAIEEIGISKLKESFWDIREWVDSNIYQNDKTPFDDGNIYLYKNQPHSKDNFDRSIRCQVKSTTNKKIKQKQKYNQLDRASLNGLSKLGGALLFVIWIKDSKNYKIYYQNLTPIFIKQLLSKTTAYNPTIPLTIFPDSPKDKLNVLRQVAFDLATINHNRLFQLKNIKPDKIVLPTFMLDSNDFNKTMQNLENQQLTIYGSYGGIMEPIGTITNNDMELIKKFQPDQTITFGNLGTYKLEPDFIYVKGQPNPILKIITGAEGKIAYIKRWGNKENKSTISTQRANSIDSQIINTKILQHLVEKREFSLNNQKIHFNKSSIPNYEIKKKKIDSCLDGLNTLKKIQNKLGINLYRDLHNKSKETCINNILSFISKDSNLSNNKLLFQTFKYGDKLIGIIKAQDDYWNCFDNELKENILIGFYNEKSQKIISEINPYLIAKFQGYKLTSFVNYQFDLIFEWFKTNKNKLKEPYMIYQINLYCEELIGQLDDSKSSNEKTLKQINKLHNLVKDSSNDRFFLDSIMILRKTNKNIDADQNDRLNQMIKSKNPAVKIYSSYLLNIKCDKSVLAKDLSSDEEQWLKQLHIIS